MEEIKKLLKDDKLFIGTEQTMKNVKLGNVKKVFVTSNCPQDILDDIKHYADMGKVEVVSLDVPNDELGVVCKKPFSISILGVKA
tara:strand:- start:185 stop:439 length:255 start_codon:yes stop_codon:yes gene_type:complete